MSNKENDLGLNEMFVYSLATLCVAAVLMAPVACTVNRHRMVADAIKGGADPIATKCAIEADTGNTPMCVAYAMKSKP